MGLFDWLWGAEAKPRRRTSVDVPGFLDIPERGFFGEYSRSPDGRYAVAWRDATEDGGHGGARSRGLGLYLLLLDGEVILEGSLQRPNDGKVADSGVFVFNDWLFSDGLDGSFHAFAPDGRVILSKRFSSNLYNNGLSTDGRFGVCQTCNSKSPDASVLTLFDLAAGKEIAAWVPESGWAQTYAFDGKRGAITLGYTDGSEFAYGFDGNFVERDLWLDWQLRQGNIWVVEAELERLGETVPPQLLERMLFATAISLNSQSAGAVNNRAAANRVRGLCLERKGDAAAALRSYEAALALDPKVGVKRRADALRKRI